jgi:hypothetical protein
MPADNTVPLGAIGSGISRLRTKGGADPTTLYDLVNAYVTMQGTLKQRPGTSRIADLSAYTTVGLVGFKSQLHVFSHEFQTVPDGYVLHVLRHPAGDSAATSSGQTEDSLIIPLVRIHYAQPFAGFLYVVAEFESDGGSGLGTIFHYWLQEAPAWQEAANYCIGDVVTPSTDNGFFYQATRLSSPNPQWQPDTPYTTDDFVEPSIPNCFMYDCVETDGTSPQSGNTEPDWPVVAGAQVFEVVNDANGATIVTSTSPAAPQPNVGTTVPGNLPVNPNLYKGYVL